MKTAMQYMLAYIEAVKEEDLNSDIEYIKENCIQLLETENKQLEKTKIEGILLGLDICKEMHGQGTLSSMEIYNTEVYFKNELENL